MQKNVVAKDVADTFVHKGHKLPSFNWRRAVLRSVLISAFAFVLSEVMVVALYTQIEPDRTSLHAYITAFVAVFVSLPIAFYFSVKRFQLERSKAALEREVQYDGMSGLYNRETFTNRLSDLLENRTIPRGAILFVDADHFKRLNDTFGHAAGDQAIELIGTAICTHIGDGDFAGRLGGEEFGVVLQQADFSEAKAIAENIRIEIAARSKSLEWNVELSASIGLAVMRCHDKLDKVLARADSCLYWAKQNGRDRVTTEFELGNAQSDLNASQKAA